MISLDEYLMRLSGRKDQDAAVRRISDLDRKIAQAQSILSLTENDEWKNFTASLANRLHAIYEVLASPKTVDLHQIGLLQGRIEEIEFMLQRKDTIVKTLETMREQRARLHEAYTKGQTSRRKTPA